MNSVYLNFFKTKCTIVYPCGYPFHTVILLINKSVLRRFNSNLTERWIGHFRRESGDTRQNVVSDNIRKTVIWENIRARECVGRRRVREIGLVCNNRQFVFLLIAVMIHVTGCAVSTHLIVIWVAVVWSVERWRTTSRFGFGSPTRQKHLV